MGLRKKRNRRSEIRKLQERVLLELELEEDPEKIRELQERFIRYSNMADTEAMLGGVSSDVVIGAVVNILGILLVLNKEELYVVRSSALSFIKRLRT